MESLFIMQSGFDCNVTATFWKIRPGLRPKLRRDAGPTTKGNQKKGRKPRKNKYTTSVRVVEKNIY